MPIEPRKRSFLPVVDAGTRLLILGSLPGEISLAHGQYYANRLNRFWHLIGAVIGENLVDLAYPDRLKTLLHHRIGLWDVVAEAQRPGSLDSALRDIRRNDLCTLAQSLPDLAAIAFNGKTAARIGRKQLGELAQRYRIVELPSSSPALTMPLPDKLAAWQILADLFQPE